MKLPTMENRMTDERPPQNRRPDERRPDERRPDATRTGRRETRPTEAVRETPPDSALEELALEDRMPATLRPSGRSSRIAGVLLLALGAATLTAPILTDVSTSVLLGWVLLAGGGLQIVHGVVSRRFESGLARIVGGVLTTAIGTVLVSDPIRSPVAILNLFALFLILEGGVRAFAALGTRPIRSWSVAFVTGAAGVLGGLLLLVAQPAPTVTFFGTLIGAYLLGAGSTLIAFGRATARSARSTPSARAADSGGSPGSASEGTSTASSATR